MFRKIQLCLIAAAILLLYGCGKSDATETGLAATLAATPEPVQAQGFFVKDGQGDPVCGASVTLVWVDDLASQQATSGADGSVALNASDSGWVWLRVSAPGYRQTSGVYEVKPPDYAQDIVLEPMVGFKRYLMAVEAGDGDDGSNPVVLLESDDGLNWSKAAYSPGAEGASPDVAWWDNAVYLLTGSVESIHLQRSPRMMRLDARTGEWSAAANASILADNACETSMGLYDFGYLTREACLFPDEQGNMMLYGANLPNNPFKDLDMNAFRNDKKLNHFVSGIAAAVDGYGGSLFHSTADRYRLVLKKQPDASEPDVFAGKDGWYMLLARKDGIQLYYTDDLEKSFEPAPGLEDGWLLTGKFGSACGVYDPDAGQYCIYAADAAGTAVLACTVNSLAGAIAASELKPVIDRNTAGLEDAAFIGNPGICIIGPTQPAVMGEPASMDNSEYIHGQVVTRKTECASLGFQFSTRAAEGEQTTMSALFSKDCLGIFTDYARPSQGVILQQTVFFNDTIAGVGFSYNVVPHGIEQDGYVLYVSKDKWSLEYYDLRENILYTLGVMGNLPAKYTLLASGPCVITADETVLTAICENANHYLFADGVLIGEFHEDLPLRTGGVSGASAVSSEDTNGEYVYTSITILPLS